MLEEQKKTVEIFRQYMDREVFDSFVVYGTGINAQAVVENCRDYPIEGVMDITKTGQSFCGLPVLSPEEILERQVRKIIIVARPALHAIIYKRIRGWCQENQIEVYDIYGARVEEKLQAQVCDSPYFSVSYENLLREIDAHEIISFDIFDTVLMRRVYEPADVFSLVDAEMGGGLPCPFSKMRREAERELRQAGEPDLYQIYNQMGDMYGLTPEAGTRLMEKELQVERKVLVVRKRMRECIAYCKERGKRVYFVSDMYLPSQILEGLLEGQGITGYEGVLVSCEHGVSKTGGLFRVLKEKAKGQSYLHIGDNEAADYRAAKENGMDAFLIMAAARMMEVSTYRGALSYVGGLGSRVMVGMLAAELFGDPFALCHSQGKPLVSSPWAFGYLYVAPLLASFLVWMVKTLAGRSQDRLLFSSRDGWLVQRAYHILAGQWGLAGLPEDTYFMVSRKAVLQALGGQGAGAYRGYLESLGLDKARRIWFFDFMSRGTCQAGVEKLLGKKATGLYFQRSLCGDREKDALEVKAYFKEQSAQEKDLRVFALCDFLECIFTSFQPSFEGVGADGGYLYGEERRTGGQMACLGEIHQGAIEYCRRFAEITARLPGGMPPPEFADGLLRYTDPRYTRIDIPVLGEFMLDDWLGGDKNTGRDALA